MPTRAEGLTPESSPEAVQAAISSCISQMMGEGGRPQEQVIRICYEMARKATGKELAKKSTRIGK